MEEGAFVGGFCDAIAEAALCVAQEAVAARPCDCHVEQASFLFHFVWIYLCCGVREEFVFQSCDEDGIKFQAFGGVNGHERDLFAGVRFVVAFVRQQ